MTDRDRQILRAVRTLGNNANAVKLRQSLGIPLTDIANLYIALSVLDDNGMLSSYFPPVDPEIGGRNFRHWHLTRLGEAAIADEGQGRDEAE